MEKHFERSSELLEKARRRKIGWILLTAWAVLIISGIVAKRVFGHAELMVFFHLPAAVCLVNAFYFLSEEYRARFKSEMERRNEIFAQRKISLQKNRELKA